VGFTCTSTWNVDEKSHGVKIQGTLLHRHSEKSSVNVHVLGDKAYTAFSGVIFAACGLVFGLLTALGVIKFASAGWFDPWLSRRPKWFQHVVRFVRGIQGDGDGWF
jgi:hypothetical protein